MKTLLFLLLPYTMQAYNPLAHKLRMDSKVCHNSQASYISRNNSFVVYNTKPWIPVWKDEINNWKDMWAEEQERKKFNEQVMNVLHRVAEQQQRNIDALKFEDSSTDSDSDMEG